MTLWEGNLSMAGWKAQLYEKCYYVITRGTYITLNIIVVLLDSVQWKKPVATLFSNICNMFNIDFLVSIAYNPPVSHITADAHSHMRLVCTLALQCLLNHIKEWLTTFIRRPSLEDVFSFINIWRTNSIQILSLHDFFCRFWFCPPKHILEIYLKKALVLGDSFQIQKVFGNKANKN